MRWVGWDGDRRRGVLVATTWVAGACVGPDDLPASATTSSTSVASSESTGEPPEPAIVIQRDPPPPPILGGTLLVTRDGRTAVVSDPDRDTVHVIDLGSAGVRASLPLDPGAMPWRMVEGADGRVHIVARGAAALVTIDPIDARVSSTQPVCNTPRGVAASDDAVVVACASGELWWFDAVAQHTEVVRVEPDLRDVFFDGDGELRVTRMRSAEVLTVARDGTLADRTWPARQAVGGASWAVSTAWRTVPTGDGGWLMSHQLGTTAHIDVERPGAYAFSTAACGAIVQSTATAFDSEGRQRALGPIPDIALAVDVAVDPTSTRVAFAVAATCIGECTSPQVVIASLDDFTDADATSCRETNALQPGPPGAVVTAVAFTPQGTLLAQQRDPAALLLIDGDAVTKIDLSGASVEDTGHRAFHERGTTGVTCASCHPEGGDDGLVWWLEQRRHTPALDVGLAGTAPFHWAGDLEDFAALVREVHEHRMGAPEQTPEQIAASERWVNALRTPAPRAPDEAAARGRERWDHYGCANCHAGAATTSNATLRIDALAEPLQVPSLHGVALHPPWFHDGHAHTLIDATREMVVRTVPGSAPTPEEIELLVAYLETL